MSKKHLSLAPQNINENCWYYEEPKGILIIQECNPLQILIPWGKLRASFKRKDKPK